MDTKRQQAYLNLHDKVSEKRQKAGNAQQRKKSSGSAPNELIFQRLATEPDPKQTYKAIEPRKFVPFEYEEMTVNNIKKACASHYHLPLSSCDILVTNKGPSCTNISQIPHRKDKVSIV